MKRFLIIFILFVAATSTLLSQSFSKGAKALEIAYKSYDSYTMFESGLEGTLISGLCGLLGGGAYCEALSVSSLNHDEALELQRIRSKFELEIFLKSKGIEPEEFYKKVWSTRFSIEQKLELNFLKENNRLSHPSIY